MLVATCYMCACACPPACRPSSAGNAKSKPREEAGPKDAHSNKRSDRSGFSSAQLNRVKRGGVGKKAFKSKKKYQRKKK